MGQLKELALIRTGDQIHYKVVSEKHIIISDRKTSYLATFQRACKELKEKHITPDVRHERNTIRARFDTIRGCRIESLYALDVGQAEELIQLGEAPGGAKSGSAWHRGRGHRSPVAGRRRVGFGRVALGG